MHMCCHQLYSKPPTCFSSVVTLGTKGQGRRSSTRPSPDCVFLSVFEDFHRKFGLLDRSWFDMDIDIQRLCRLCAKRYDHSIDVLHKSENRSSFVHLIQEFFSVIVQAHDGLPSRICVLCKVRLETWEQIREEVSAAQEFLTQCMLQQQGAPMDRPEPLHDLHPPDDLSQLQWRVLQPLPTDEVCSEDHLLVPPPEGDPPQTWEQPPPPPPAETEELDPAPSSKPDIKRSWRDDVEYKCIICSKVFARRDNLKKHLVIHTGEKSFKCDKCPQKFSRASDLKVHYRIHTAEKPLQCHFCSQQFRESSNFRKHLRTHSGDRPFKCHICNKHFAQSPHLKRHLRIHSGERPYQCGVCSRQFSQSSTLRTHERTHSGAKPHACKVCSRSFRHASTLKAHARTHSGEKAFYCDKCPKSFFWRTSFDCHVLTHASRD